MDWCGGEGVEVRVQPPEEVIPYTHCGSGTAAAMTKIKRTENMSAPHGGCMNFFLSLQGGAAPHKRHQAFIYFSMFPIFVLTAAMDL